MRQYRGWDERAYGNNGNPGYWARLHREILFKKNEQNTVVYDLSYETNFNLWRPVLRELVRRVRQGPLLRLTQ